MRKTVLQLLILFIAISLEAHEPYKAKVSVGSESATVTAPNLVDLSRELRSDNIEELIPFYTPVTATSLSINLRGINAFASFAEDSTVLVVDIPQANISESFNGGSRDDSILLFKDYIRDAGRHAKLLRAYAHYSPIDPIAGNPFSLQAQMAQADYLLGHLSPFDGCQCDWTAQPITHLFQAGTEFARGSFSHGFDTTEVTFPLRYSYSPNRRTALIIDAPFAYIRNGGASSVIGSLGVGFRYPLTHHWSLTPILRVGTGGSLDLCTAGTFASAGINSVYNLKISNYLLSMTNYVGYFTNTNFWLSGVNFNYHLHNYIFKNGLTLTSCEWLTLCNRPVNFSLTFIDSYFAREHLYMKHYDEIGFEILISHFNPSLTYDCLSVGATYQFGQKHFKGYSINIKYQF